MRLFPLPKILLPIKSYNNQALEKVKSYWYKIFVCGHIVLKQLRSVYTLKTEKYVEKAKGKVGHINIQLLLSLS